MFFLFCKLSVNFPANVTIGNFSRHWNGSTFATEKCKYLLNRRSKSKTKQIFQPSWMSGCTFATPLKSMRPWGQGFCGLNLNLWISIFQCRENGSIYLCPLKQQIFLKLSFEKQNWPNFTVPLNLGSTFIFPAYPRFGAL